MSGPLVTISATPPRSSRTVRHVASSAAEPVAEDSHRNPESQISTANVHQLGDRGARDTDGDEGARDDRRHATLSPQR
jgi:hypothetical protein